MAENEMKELVDIGITENVTNSDGLAAAMKNGKIATIPNSVWYNGTMYDQAPELSGDWGTFPHPKFKEAGGHAAISGASVFSFFEWLGNKLASFLYSYILNT